MNITSLMVAGLLLGAPSNTSLPPPEQVSSCIAQSRVCIDEGIDGVADDTEAKLKRQLVDNDRIVIVMLPSTSTPLSSSELASFVDQVDELTEHQYIIGLSVGREVVGHSSLLPEGVAADQMRRARNVSTNTAETHLTFIMNIHRWLSQHPDVTLPPKPVNPDQSTEPADGSGFPWGLVLLGAVILGFVGAVITRRNRSSTGWGFTAPSPVKELLIAVMELRKRVSDSSLQAVIKQACDDTEQYFQRNKEPRFIDADAEQFSGHLRSVREVLLRYIDIQDNPRYYRRPQTLLRQGSEAITGFASFALSSIQRGTDSRLMEFTVQTDILSAQRDI